MGRTEPSASDEDGDVDDGADSADGDWDDDVDEDVVEDGRGDRRDGRTPSRVGRSANGIAIPTLVLLPLSFALLAPLWAYPRIFLDVPPYVVCFALYLVLGATTYLRPLQRVVLAVLFDARRPTRAEQRKLQPAWDAVRRRARVAADMYRILVVDDPGPTAVATGGAILVVTTGALSRLPSDELEGILAHELGHHVGLHDVALPMAHWLALPVVAMAQLGRLLSEVPLMEMTILTRLAAYAALGVLLTMPVRLAAGFFLDRLLVDDTVVWVASGAGFVVGGALLVASGPLTRRLGRLVGRFGEPHADDVAERLGFGPALSAALDRFQGNDRADDKRYPRVVARRIFAARHI